VLFLQTLMRPTRELFSQRCSVQRLRFRVTPILELRLAQRLHQSHLQLLSQPELHLSGVGKLLVVR
jgi:hypothetical protein